jgi:hypothetical protein
VVSALDAPAAVLLNKSPGRSVALELVGRSPRARVPFGARVRAEAGGRVLVRDLPGGGSYLATSDPRIFLGLGDASRIEKLDVTWPSGRTESWRDLEVSGTVRVAEGTGRR